MTQDFDPKEFLQRAAFKIGFIRDRYIENNIPTDMKDIAVFFFFGDYKSKFLLSSMLLKNYIRNIRKPRYSILCSYKGDVGLYPYVNEYWSINSNIESHNIGFSSSGKEFASYESNLLRYFPGDVINCSMFKDYYDKCFTTSFFKHYKEINYTLPAIPSMPMDVAKKLSNTNHTVFLHPSKRVNMWFNGKSESVFIHSKFWESLVDKLLSEGIPPIVYLNNNSYDISPAFANKCIYITDLNIMNVLAVMRSSCVLDICTGISRLALIARAPHLIVDSRQQYFGNKEQEVDDMCSLGIPKDYVFLLNNSIENDWGYVIERTVSKLKKFLPSIDRNKLTSCSELDDVLSYDSVREKKIRKIGLHFIKVNQEEI